MNQEESKAQAAKDLLEGKEVEYTGLECEDCGEWNAHSTTCPFSEDIYNETVPVNLCDECYYQRAQDI